MSKPNDYETDFYEWTKIQADVLKRRAVDELDWENLAHEIECAGTRYRHVIRDNLHSLLAYLLKWKYIRKNASIESGISTARTFIKTFLKDCPSLKSYPEKALLGQYGLAKFDVHSETEVLCPDNPPPEFPEKCEWTIEQILDHKFLP
jgi:hypothetical protein